MRDIWFNSLLEFILDKSSFQMKRTRPLRPFLSFIFWQIPLLIYGMNLVTIVQNWADCIFEWNWLVQEEYAEKEELGRLSCDHRYHYECVNQWLKLKNWCPVCKTSVASPPPWSLFFFFSVCTDQIRSVSKSWSEIWFFFS